MKNINLVIIEGFDIMADLLRSFFLLYSSQFKIVGVANDGKKGIELIREYRPDAVVLDMVLPDVSGLTVMDSVINNDFIERPKFIIMSMDQSTQAKLMAIDHGADEFFSKPVELSSLAKSIITLVDNSKSPPSPLRDVLTDLGILPKHKGYQYVLSGIELATSDMTLLDALTKNLYPLIAKQHGTTAVRVERSIRHAIKTAWESGPSVHFGRYLDMHDPTARPPSNGFFIAGLVDYVRRNS